MAVSAAVYLREAKKQTPATPGAAVDASVESASRGEQARPNEAKAAVQGPREVSTRGVGVPADPFEFIRALARRAFDGDSEAQYLIGRELDRCEATLSLVRRESDPETAILNFQWPTGLKQWTISEFRRCARLRNASPFDELPARAEGYGFQYWQKRAQQSGHPVAVTEHSLRTLTSLGPDTKLSSEERIQAQSDLAAAAASDRPDALLRMGFHLLPYEYPARVIRGVALMLAACRMGADCASSSSVVPVSLCHDQGDPLCPPGMDVEIMVRHVLDAEAFAQAYAQSQQVENDARTHDAARMTPWMDLF